MSKSVAYAWGSMLALWATTPRIIRDGIIVAVVFYVVDTITGYALAWMEGRVRSKTLFQSAFKKALQYSALIVLFAGISLLVQNPLMAFPGIGIVIMTEVTSILENVYKMQEGGAKMPIGIDDLLSRIGRYLAVGRTAELMQPPPGPPGPRRPRKHKSEEE